MLAGTANLSADAIRAPLDAGKSNRQIARELGTSEKTVRRWLTRNGLHYAWSPPEQPTLAGPAQVTQRKADSRTKAAVLAEAEAVRLAIPPVGSDRWASVRAVADKTGLDPNQVERRIALLRETVPADALVSSAEGYRFTRDATVVSAFTERRARTVTTILRRTWRGVVKPFLEGVNPGDARRVERLFARLTEDLGDLAMADAHKDH